MIIHFDATMDKSSLDSYLSLSILLEFNVHYLQLSVDGIDRRRLLLFLLFDMHERQNMFISALCECTRQRNDMHTMVEDWKMSKGKRIDDVIDDDDDVAGKLSLSTYGYKEDT